VIRERANEILEQNIIKSMAPGNLLSSVVDLKEFVEKFPPRVNRILDQIGNNELKFRVDAIDEKVVLEGLQKVANRITLGLVVAALIVGAAMLMRVETSFRIFGYPGIAMIFFLLAAAAGMVLAFSILFYDEKRRKKRD
jgi:predicted unusual protein kinase regulating ubiquinone biosynthesis (AarF/ABC1/UbiB family)